MNADALLALLGRSAHSATVVAALDALGTVARPSLAAAPPDGVPRAWIAVRRRGVELGFVDSAYLGGEPAAEVARFDRLVLDQIYLYGRGQPDITPFAEALPHGLDFADGRAGAREKLVRTLGAPRASRETDAFHLPDRRMTLSYAPGAQEIACVLVWLPLSPWKAWYPQPAPTTEQWTSFFGVGLDDPALLAALSPLDVPARAARGVREVSFVRDAGIELHFDDDRRFRGVRFYADREADARGWRGPLPLGVRFSDGPEALLRKVAHAPAAQDDDRIYGFARWQLAEADLHVLYSTVDNTLKRIQWSAPAKP